MAGDALIVEAARTPVGRRGGMLAGWHPADLLAEVLGALVQRAGVDPGEIDDVIVACVDQVGEQGVNVGRSATLAAGFPETVPATTVDRQCHSFALAGVDPVEMLSGPIPARRKVLDRAGLELDDIELAEVNEMGRRGARHGLQTMCEGGGMANATILELV